jgi:hypothetical protein
MALFTLLFLFSFPLAIPHIKEFRLLGERAIEIPDDGLALIHSRHYADQRQSSLRIAKATIPSLYIEKDYLELTIAYYKRDEQTRNGILNNWSSTNAKDAIKDVKSWQQQGLPALFHLSIDGVPVNTQSWLLKHDGTTNQYVYQTHIALKDVSIGQHRLTIDKFIHGEDSGEYKLLKNWDSLTFFRKQPGKN